MVLTKTNNQNAIEQLKTLNSLEVFETNEGEDAYVLIRDTPVNRQKLNEVGIDNKVIDEFSSGYDDGEDSICILSLALHLGIADDYSTKFGLYKWNEDTFTHFFNKEILSKLKEETLFSPVTGYLLNLDSEEVIRLYKKIKKLVLTNIEEA